MVGKVLTGNGITRCEKGAYALVGGVAEGFCAAVELSYSERDKLLELCRQRLDAFRAQRGEEVFAHCSRHRTPISDSIKHRVLTRARGRCECCGAREYQRALSVAPIIPRNQGGSDDLRNLQALCSRCNAGKRDAVCLRKRAPPTSAACRPATPIARTVVCSARWRPAAGCCWKTNWRCASRMPIRSRLGTAW